VRDLIAVMDTLEVRDAALIGCSLGGMIALDVVLAHPERAWGLVMVASAPRGLEETPDEEAWGTELTASVDAAVRAGDVERAMDLQLEVWAVLGTDDPVGRAIREIAFDNLHTLTMDDSGAEQLRPPAAQRLEEVVVPTLVLPADHDPPILLRASRVLAERIPGARVVHIPDTDHVIGMRRPEDFNREVLHFLTSVRG
jgi:pimeloyl-ACP methyl ester carboxylesterase